MNNNDISTAQEVIDYFKQAILNNDFISSRIENAILQELHIISEEMIKTEMKFDFGKINWDSIAHEFSPNQIIDITSISSKLASDIVSNIQQEFNGSMLMLLGNRVSSLDEKNSRNSMKFIYLTD